MNKYEIIEHTADVGISVWGDGLSGLFEMAAKGMFSLIVSEIPANPTETRQIILAARTHEDLLVSWLNELIFLFEVYEIVPVEYDLTVGKDEDHYSLTAQINCLNIDPELIECEIKAATYHNLQITENNNQFQTKIIFDL